MTYTITRTITNTKTITRTSTPTLTPTIPVLPDRGEGKSLIQTGDGGYMVMNDSNHLSLCNAFVLTKTDSSGNLEWSKAHSCPDALCSLPLGIIGTSSDSGYLAVGSAGTMGLIYVIKTDQAGNLQWSRTFSGAGYFSTIGAAVEPSPGEYVLAGGLNNDFYLAKMNASGEILWEKFFDGTLDDEDFKDIKTIPGGFIAAGEHTVIKADSSGNTYTSGWFRTGGAEVPVSVNSVAEVTGGGYILAGWSESVRKAALLKLDASGGQVWSRTYGYTDDVAWTVIETPDLGYIASGLCKGAGTNNAMMAFKTDSSGNQEWYTLYDSPGWDAGNRMIKAIDGNYVIAGRFGGYCGSCVTTYNVWLRKIDVLGNIIW